MDEVPALRAPPVETYRGDHRSRRLCHPWKTVGTAVRPLPNESVQSSGSRSSGHRIATPSSGAGSRIVSRRHQNRAPPEQLCGSPPVPTPAQGHRHRKIAQASSRGQNRGWIIGVNSATSDECFLKMPLRLPGAANWKSALRSRSIEAYARSAGVSHRWISSWRRRTMMSSRCRPSSAAAEPAVTSSTSAPEPVTPGDAFVGDHFRASTRGYLIGVNLNFCPPMLASAMRPSLGRVKTATFSS